MKDSPFQLYRKGRRGFLLKGIEWLLGLRKLDRLYQTQFSDETGQAFLDKTMKVIGFDYKVQSGSLEGLEQAGPVVIIANHPFGGAEGVALIDAVLKVRPDTKALANQLLNSLPGLKDLFIGVDILSEGSREQRKQANRLAVEQATRWVSDGGVLIIFPAGEVARREWFSGVVHEAPWRNTAGAILKAAGASVLPVYVEGRNSRFFYFLGLIHPLLRTVWLARELINKKGTTIHFRVGQREPASHFRNLHGKTLTNALRMRTLLLADSEFARAQEPARVFSNAQCAVIDPVEPEMLDQEIRGLADENLLYSKGDMDVWCCPAGEIPSVLREIGRLREVTFRQVGEGTGQELDLDRFDKHYLHLFIWNTGKREVVGAYRIGPVDQLLAKEGLEGLYSRSLFHYDRRFLNRLGQCLEMGRSFVRPEYQKSLGALQLLWKGIGAWVTRNPQYRILFGPVSISKEYQELSRYLIAMSMEENYYNHELAELVTPSRPLPKTRKLPWSREMLSGLGDIEQLTALVQLLEKDRGVPVLMRQYLKLSGTFVGFNVDRDFNDALDGLIIVDLLKSERKVLRRYMGEEGVRRLESAHSPESATV